MPTDDKKPEDAIKKLLQSEDDQLLIQLAIRSQAIVSDPGTAGTFTPPVAADVSEMGALDELREFGQRLFQRWNLQAYQLVCGAEKDDAKDRQSLLTALGLGETAAASALYAFLVANLALSPAVAVVVSALIVKRFVTPAHAELCSTWKASLPRTP